MDQKGAKNDPKKSIKKLTLKQFKQIRISLHIIPLTKSNQGYFTRFLSCTKKIQKNYKQISQTLNSWQVKQRVVKIRLINKKKTHHLSQTPAQLI